MDEQPKYLCELCNVRFNDFAEHVLNDNHAGSDLFSVGCYALHISTGKFGYYHIRFETTFNQLRATGEINQSVLSDIDSNHKLVYNGMPPMTQSTASEVSDDDKFLDVTMPAETWLSTPEDTNLFEELMDLLPAAVTSLNEQGNLHPTRIKQMLKLRYESNFS